MIRAVLDVDIFVSAAIVQGGAPDRIVRAWRQSRFAAIMSPIMIEDVGAVLLRPHIRQRYKITDSDDDHEPTPQLLPCHEALSVIV